MEVLGSNRVTTTQSRKSNLGNTSYLNPLADVGILNSGENGLELEVGEQDSDILINLFPSNGSMVKLPEATGSGIVVTVNIMQDITYNAIAANIGQNTSPITGYTADGSPAMGYKIISCPKGTLIPGSVPGNEYYQGIMVGGALSGSRNPSSETPTKIGAYALATSPNLMTLLWDSMSDLPLNLTTKQNQAIDKNNTRSIWALMSTETADGDLALTTSRKTPACGLQAGSWIRLIDAITTIPDPAAPGDSIKIPGWLIVGSYAGSVGTKVDGETTGQITTSPILLGGGTTSKPDLMQSKGQPWTFGSEGY